MTLAHRSFSSDRYVDTLHDPESGDYSAVCPELPGCASAGETEEEARANIREAIELYLAPGDIELPAPQKALHSRP